MTTPRRKIPPIAALACAAALLGAGCGSDEEEPKGEPIPSATVTEINKQLDALERRFEFGGGACADIENDSIPAIQDQVRQVPDSVSADVRRALQESVARLADLSSQQCDENKQEPQTEPQTVEEPPPTVTVPPETQTQTTPPETQTTPAPEPQQPQKPGNGNGGNNGNGNGGNNGNGGGNSAPGEAGGAPAPGGDG